MDIILLNSPGGPVSPALVELNLFRANHALVTLNNRTSPGTGETTTQSGTKDKPPEPPTLRSRERPHTHWPNKIIINLVSAREQAGNLNAIPISDNSSAEHVNEHETLGKLF